MMPSLISLLSGIIFGLGLSLSQMTNPNKVINFLDITGNWDPSLAFVMLGALSVTFISFKQILKRPKPFLIDDFHVSKRSSIDKALIGGAIIFGIGWGISGYCPGPAVASIGFGSVEAFVMVLSIYAGFLFQKWGHRKLSRVE
ncbi:MAG: YeeE/YedE family protein [Methylococcales bacterium]|nr:YeeE/YedE family protein [Methylococcales bacterium]